MGKYTQFNYISQFPTEIRTGIRNAVTRKLNATGLPKKAVNEAVRTAMDSKLIDLEEIISVSYWLNKANKR